MSGTDLIVLTSLCLCIFHGCQSQDCTHINSDKPHDCELHIENGYACYTKIEEKYWDWRADITCLEGFYLKGSRIRICTATWRTDYKWDGGSTQCIPNSTTSKPLTTTTTNNSQTTITPIIPFEDSTTSKTLSTTTSSTTISLSADATTQETDGKAIISAEHKSDSFLVVCITVPFVALGLVVGGLSLWFMHRRRRNALSGGLSRKRNSTSTVTNRAYDVPADNVDRNHAASVESNSSEYVDIPDNSRDQNTSVSEYNTLPSDGRTYNSADYNHIPVQDDTYDHTTNTVINDKRESETYSHLNDAKHDKNRPAFSNSENTYNALQMNGECIEMNDLDSASVDPYYDYTNTRSDRPASIELETFAHVDHGLDEDVYVNTQEYHD